ncbi:MAG: type II secretion system protein E [Anaerolineaceae bacterium 4572_32.1]|nr:MAG: type II secretion system protein E [Anaerolineaceae bacterium 4572_32.1]
MVDQLPNPVQGVTWEEAQRLKLWIADKLRSSLEPNVKLDRSPETMQLIRERFTLLCAHANVNLPQEKQKQLYQEILDELLGFGPIEPLLQDDSVTEVMVNGPAQVYAERSGKVVLTDIRFLNDDHVMQTINKIIKPLGRQVDHTWPMVDARLPDGSRVNAIIPPCAIDGPSVTIRKFSKIPFTVQNLIDFGTLTEDMADFLEACVVSRLNIIVSGGTGSGKTTLLNVLSSYIPDEDRIVTIEDAAELQLSQSHVVRLEAKPAEPDGTGRVAIRDLVINSLRMRPERIVIGECRGGEALDMLQAMNTGHDGSLTTIHANTPRDTISRLETLTLMAGMELPLMVVRQQIASALDLIVQQTRLRDGSRKIINITEVQGMEGDTVVLQDIFRFEEEGEKDGKVVGRMKPMGIRPRFMDRLSAHGFNFPPSMFMDMNKSFSRR